MIAYETPYDKIVEVLGGKGEIGMDIRSVSEVNKLISRGLPVSTLAKISGLLKMGQKELIGYLEVGPTHSKMLRDVDEPPIYSGQYLDSNLSERLIKLAEIIYRGKELFGEMELFQGWMKSRPPVFEGERPIDYLSTFTGQEYILTIMGRIEHGVYS